MNRDPRGQVDYGVPQTAPFWVGQRIRNTHAGRGVVISVQAKDPADPHGSLPGGRWWEVVVEFDQPYVPPQSGPADRTSESSYSNEKTTSSVAQLDSNQ
jgi:hypothetical protein